MTYYVESNNLKLFYFAVVTMFSLTRSKLFSLGVLCETLSASRPARTQSAEQISLLLPCKLPVTKRPS